MHFDSFVIVLMAGIMVIGGGILIAMLALESPWWNLELPVRLRLHLRPSIAHAAPSDLVTKKNQSGGRRPAVP